MVESVRMPRAVLIVLASAAREKRWHLPFGERKQRKSKRFKKNITFSRVVSHIEIQIWKWWNAQKITKVYMRWIALIPVLFPEATCFYRFLSERTQCWNAQLRSSLKCILMYFGSRCTYVMHLHATRRWHLHIFALSIFRSKGEYLLSMVARVTVLGCEGPKCAVAWCTPFRPTCLTHFDAKDSALRCTYGILFTTGELFQTHCSQVRQLHRQRSGQIAIDASTDARQHQHVHAFSCMFHIA